MQYMMIVCISRKVAVIASQFGFKASKIFFVGHQEQTFSCFGDFKILGRGAVPVELYGIIHTTMV